MKIATIKIICRALIISLTMLSFQIAQAGIITTNQLATTATVQADRATVMNFMSRADVASQLQSMGLEPKVAQDRVAALTDQEVQSLAGKLNSLPAGATSGWVWGAVVIIIAVLLWYKWGR